MAHFDRGVYEPGEDIRVFDGSEDDEDVEGSRLPLLIVLALLVLAMFAGVVWLAYTQGVARGRTETPVLTAQNGPARVAPQNPGGAAEPYKGFKIYEQPAPPDEAVDNTTTPSAPPPAAPKPVAATPAPAAKPVVAAAPPPPVAKPVVTAAAPPPPAAKPVAPTKPAPVAATPAPKPAVKVAAATPAPAKPVPAPAKPAASVVTKAASPPPAVKTAAASVPAGPATGAPRSLALVPAKPAAATPAPTAAPVASGAFTLQIGAYKSQAEAQAAWKAYKAKHSALLADAVDDVQQADLGDKGTWYRLRITGFPSKDVASATCDRLKTDGGNCFLGK